MASTVLVWCVQMPEEKEVKVEFSGRVPEKEAEFFKVTFPQYGSVNWFINASLKAFNDKVRHNPGLAESVDLMIDELLKSNREPNAAGS